MNELLPADRPREKLERHGPSVLGDNELLAVVIGHGTAGTGALALANDLLRLGGGAAGLAKLPRDRLVGMMGIGPAQASRVQAAIELGRRTMVGQDVSRPQFLQPKEAARHLLPLYGAFPVERFGVMLLDTRHRLLMTRIVSVGSLDASLAHPREVFREALVANAAALVAFHSHPSGDPSPSRDDIVLTRRLKAAGEIVGVDLADHIILTERSYFSMKEARLV
jgi:DNA repair protein RadC